jgi:predicted ATPase
LPLLGGFFACQAFGTSLLKGFAQPLAVYQVLHESTARSRLEAAGSSGLTPLVGREQEIALLLERWGQVKEGSGQVVLLSGEAGIGKSRLVQVLTEQVAAEPQAWLTPCQCSPYHQHSALYPWIDLLERVALRFEREEAPAQKLSKLEGFLVQYGLPLAEAVPLFAALLSLPLPADYAPLTMSPERQRQQTLQALLAILLRIAAQQPILFVMEDLHWVDPSTLELLSLLVDQGPTARILALWTFRPDFSPPWTGRSHLTQVTVHRLPRQQAVEVICQVAHGKTLPPEVVEQIVAKTDGVPLFVEELTKMVLESGLLQEREHRYEPTGPLPSLAIPATLHDSLMARLDRLATVKGLAQLGATLGREFSYALLQAVSPWDEETLQRGLHQLVAAEFLFQRGLPPHATYLFKHALIQEAAYQSLLRSIRQQYHQRIAQVLAEHFPETAETQPEVLAHHYTEAGLPAQAIPHWHRAGEGAIQRSAHMEAIAHLTKGLKLVTMLPHTLERSEQELTLHIALGSALMASKGFAAPEVERVYTRARELCQQVGDTPQLFWALAGLRTFYTVNGKLQTAHELAEQLLRVAESQQDSALLVTAHGALATSYFYRGEIVSAYTHVTQGYALYTPEQHRFLAFLYGFDAGVRALAYAAMSLWVLGFPQQALRQSRNAVTLAQEIRHPASLAMALSHEAWLHQFRREAPVIQEQLEAAIVLANEQGLPFWVAMATILRGWALMAQGQGTAGIAQMHQGLAGYRATGAAMGQTYLRALLVEGYGKVGQVDTGLRLLAEALAEVERTEERVWEAELYRLKGKLLLRQGTPDEHQAETCFLQALDVARRQQAKSLELRAAMSLGRLWQQRGQRAEAYEVLAPIYGWFTEGFDTADLQEARALLKELGG